MIEEPSVTDILISHFGTDKTLQEIRQDYEDLELMIERERSANGEGSRRLVVSLGCGVLRPECDALVLRAENKVAALSTRGPVGGARLRLPPLLHQPLQFLSLPSGQQTQPEPRSLGRSCWTEPYHGLAWCAVMVCQAGLTPISENSNGLKWGLFKTSQAVSGMSCLD
jgi:hypothetical protein